MDDSVMQQHLSHYKQATESAREELAVLNTKYQSLHSQLLDARSKTASQEALVQDLREAIDRHKENEARQSSLISSLRERIHNTEEEMGSIASSKSIMDMKLQALIKQNEEMKERILQAEIKSEEYLSKWNKTKEKAEDLKRRSEEFVSRLSNKLCVDSVEHEKPMEAIISLVELCCKERDRQKTLISTLEESVKSREVECKENRETHEVECKASRETVRRLLADVENEQKLSATRASALSSVRQELESALVRNQNLERENQSLRNKLQQCEVALAAAKDHSDRYEKRSEDLEHKLLRSHNEAQTSHNCMEAFIKEVNILLGLQPSSAEPKEELILEKLREVCRREKSSTATAIELESRLTEVSQELAKQTELQREAEHREQQIQSRCQSVEAELLTTGVNKDGLSQEKQQYLKFLEKLSEKMKIEHIATDLGFDMRLEAILARADQLTRQEGTALVENKTLVYSLRKKVKEQKVMLESKDLHMDLLRRKVAQLDEDKRSRSALAVEREDVTLTNRKLQKKVERLQAELSVMRFSNTELKAQLADTNELKIRVMEQKQAIEKQSKSLGTLEKNKAKVEKKLNTVKTELQNQELRARDELHQANKLLHSQAGTMAELAHREKKLLDFCTVVSQMLGVDMPATLLNSEAIKRLEVLIHSSHPHFPIDCHCAVPHLQHLMSPACSSLTSASLGPEVPALLPPPATDTP
ncbi:coiled-coil domain-containing protein 170 [Astyanax mexicanus]|uniref:Coiled-coil domain containing 170 n=1 Tax=Astyanax mexicanus TaxID=7994 RepID=A0A8B9LUI4_ASTMX|nr:coiled-coil domain-containing protein 170 [Astyanax mexicanus]XP_049320120.1 coiled-coil domain-containing protein 170 [Astyanax mexicanus]